MSTTPLRICLPGLRSRRPRESPFGLGKRLQAPEEKRLHRESTGGRSPSSRASRPGPPDVSRQWPNRESRWPAAEPCSRWLRSLGTAGRTFERAWAHRRRSLLPPCPVGGQAGLLTRTFLGVAVTIQPDHVSTASVRNRLATLSCKAMRPGCGSRTSSRPWWIPGAYLRASEKSRSWVTRNRPSAYAARHTTSSSSPPMPSAGTVSTSCPRAVRSATSPAGRFSSSLILTARGPRRLADLPAPRLRQTR